MMMMMMMMKKRRRSWGLDGVITLPLRPLYPREKCPLTHFMARWVNPGAGLDVLKTRKTFGLE